MAWSPLQVKHAPRKCEFCGKAFVPLSGRAKYCNVGCRRKAKAKRKEQANG